MFGVRMGEPWQLTSPQPRSSARMYKTFGVLIEPPVLGVTPNVGVGYMTGCYRLQGVSDYSIAASDVLDRT